MVGCLGSEPRLAQSQKRLFCRRLGEAAAPGVGAGGMRAVPRLCILYPGICLTTEENHGKPQLGYSALHQGTGQLYASATLIPVPSEQKVGFGLNALESRKISRF